MFCLLHGRLRPWPFFVYFRAVMRWRNLAAAPANYAVIEVMSREVGRVVVCGGEAVVITDNKIDAAAAVLLVREYGRGAAGGVEPEREHRIRLLITRQAGIAADHLQYSGGLPSGRERRGKQAMMFWCETTSIRDYRPERAARRDNPTVFHS